MASSIRKVTEENMDKSLLVSSWIVHGRERFELLRQVTDLDLEERSQSVLNYDSRTIARSMAFKKFQEKFDNLVEAITA